MVCNILLKVAGYSLLINVHENITLLFSVQDPGMNDPGMDAFNFTAKKSCISL